MPGNPFIQTNTPSTKVFALADNYPIPGSNVVKLHHDVRKPSRTVDMVPYLTNNSLLSGGKFAQAGYVSVCDDKEVNLYDTYGENDYFRGGRAQRMEMPQGKPVAHSSS